MTTVVLVYAMLMLIVSLQSMVDYRRREEKRLAEDKRQKLGAGQGIKILPVPLPPPIEWPGPPTAAVATTTGDLPAPVLMGMIADEFAARLGGVLREINLDHILPPAKDSAERSPVETIRKRPVTLDDLVAERRLVKANADPVLFGTTLNHPKRLGADVLLPGVPEMMGDECEDGAALLKWLDPDSDLILMMDQERELQCRMIAKRHEQTMERRRFAALGHAVRAYADRVI